VLLLKRNWGAETYHGLATSLKRCCLERWPSIVRSQPYRKFSIIIKSLPNWSACVHKTNCSSG